MKSRKLVVGVASILAASLGLGVIAPADGQVNESPMPGGAVQWGLVDAIGYGGLGSGLGLLATRAIEGSSVGPVAPPGTARVHIGATTLNYGFSATRAWLPGLLEPPSPSSVPRP